mmetsp:Transcript_30544/g.93426  ORF Transcript_30544/g.93426 Transcript_30544/m.93426 type:complete len:216 (-) Transcript_30544:123-770(-)
MVVAQNFRLAHTCFTCACATSYKNRTLLTIVVTIIGSPERPCRHPVWRIQVLGVLRPLKLLGLGNKLRTIAKGCNGIHSSIIGGRLHFLQSSVHSLVRLPLHGLKFFLKELNLGFGCLINLNSLSEFLDHLLPSISNSFSSLLLNGSYKFEPCFTLGVGIFLSLFDESIQSLGFIKSCFPSGLYFIFSIFLNGCDLARRFSLGGCGIPLSVLDLL